MNFALPNRAFADGGMENLLLEKMTDDYCPVDVNLPALNSVLGNFNSFKGIGLGNLVVLGGAPKSMKTTTALYWMRRASETPGIRPVLLTWEMTEDDLRLRMARGYFDKGTTDFVPERLSHEELLSMLDHYNQHPPDFDPEWIRMRDRRLEHFMLYLEHLHAFGYNWFIFDNIQKLTVDGIRDTDYAVKVEHIMFALEDFVTSSSPRATLVGLSQINRSASSNRYDSPTKHDLLGGTAIESQASQIIMLDHSRQAYDPDLNCTRGLILVEGNRDGAQFGEILYQYNWDTMTMRQGMPDEEHLWPQRKKRPDAKNQ